MVIPRISPLLWALALCVTALVWGGACSFLQTLSAVRVATVGDSITFGGGLADRANDSYPAKLAQLLGSHYHVRNFGAKGATALRRGDVPYWETSAFLEALGWRPDAVVIALGTNDSKLQNWRYGGEFREDYLALIRAFAVSEPELGIWLCYPPPALRDRWGIRGRIIEGQIIPTIDSVAQETGLPVIDLFSAFEGRVDLMLDGIHPNPEGAQVLARLVRLALVERETYSTPARR